MGRAPGGEDAPLVLERLTKRFPTRGELAPALDRFSAVLHAGELLALVGPNGAGKSTALRVMAGLVRADSGVVYVAGRADPGRRERSAHLGGMLDGAASLYPRLTVRENIEYFAALKGIAPREAAIRTAVLLARFGLADRAKHAFQTLSRGLRQRAAIVCHVVHRPSVLLLDEPALGLDPECRETLAHLLTELRHEGMAILVASHELDFVARIATRVAYMRRGRMVDVEAGNA